jgi:3'-phosphoadenosine 5'-phosphosulfate sulfotransferase (PAPS reductase)/FAD synthetase
MLTHDLYGPFRDGSYAVGYPTPGCSVMTVVSTGMTKERAQQEAARLNEEQEKRAAAIQRDRQASAMMRARLMESRVLHPFSGAGETQ